jgi:hypothetical protein
MPTNAYDPVKAGDALKIHAEAWNTMLSMARERRALNVENQSDGEWKSAQPVTVLVKNTTASTIARFGVIQFSDPTFDPTGGGSQADFVDRVVLNGIAPNASLGFGRFGIATQQIKAGKIGTAIVDGIVGIKIDVADALHMSAEAPVGSSGLLKTTYAGSVEIIWKASGTGEKFAVVRMGRHVHMMPFLAKITASYEVGTRRWKYDWREVGLTADGDFPQTTSSIQSGGSDTAKVLQAFNTVEWVQHEDSDMIGPGITASTLPSGFDAVPIANNTVVIMHRVWMGTHFGYAFTCPNAIDGSCGASFTGGGGGGGGSGPVLEG